MKQVRGSNGQPGVIAASEFCGAEMGWDKILPKARAAIPTKIHPGSCEALQDVQNKVIVSTKTQNMPRQKEGWAGSHGFDPIRIAGIGQFVKQLAGKFPNSAAENEFSPPSHRGPKRIVCGQQPEFQPNSLESQSDLRSDNQRETLHRSVGEFDGKGSA
jgi:hypothetical protein